MARDQLFGSGSSKFPETLTPKRGMCDAVPPLLWLGQIVGAVWHTARAGRGGPFVLNVASFLNLPYCIGMDFDILAIRPNRLALFVTLERLSHVECITSVIVVVCNSSIDRVSKQSISKSDAPAVGGRPLTPSSCTA